MKIKKIIYISIIPLQQKIEKDYHINYLLDNKIEIEFWDMTDLYFKGVHIKDSLDRPYIKNFATLNGFENNVALENKKETIFVPIFGLVREVAELFRIISHHRCILFFYATSQQHQRNGSLIKKIFSRKLLHIFNYKKVSPLLLNFISNKYISLLKDFKFIKEFDTVFTAGSVAKNLYQNLTECIDINSPDYEEYLLFKKDNSRLVNEKYCVFLDENVPFAFDSKIFGIPTPDAEKYYNSINHFFSFIEERFNINVVIANHPKSDHEPSIFKAGRQFKYKTNELAKNCEFAIAHVSTSISFPIFYNKPIVFIYTNEYQRIYRHTYLPVLYSVAGFLNLPTFNIDDPDLKKNFKLSAVDLERYSDYKYRYHTSQNTESTQTKDIVLSYLKKYS